MSFEEANRIAKESYPYKIDKEKYVKTILEAPIFDYLKKFEFQKVLWPDGAKVQTVILEGRGLEHCPVRLTGYALRLDLVFAAPQQYSSRQLPYSFKVEELWVSVDAPEELKVWARRDGVPAFLKIETLIKKMERNQRVAAFLDRFPNAKATVTIAWARFEAEDFYLNYGWQTGEVFKYRLPPDIKSTGFPEFDKELREFDSQKYLKKWYYSSARCREANVKTLEMRGIEGSFDSEGSGHYGRGWSLYFLFQKNDCVESHSFFWKQPASKKLKK